MIAQLIFDWAKRTPDRSAIIYNDRPWSYQSFAQFIALARGYFVRRGYIGPGYAVLAVYNTMDFWILSLALRSLGLTTVAVGFVSEEDAQGKPNVRAAVSKLGRPDVRCVVTSPVETWAGLDGLCTELGIPLLPVLLNGETAMGLEALEAPHPLGGHILLTSGTTGSHKMVLISPALDAIGLQRNVELIGMNQNTVLSVFDFPAWTAIGYRCAASPWTVGGAVVIEQRQFYRALLCPGITHAVLVPVVLSVILAAPAKAFPRNDAIQLVVAGGAMPRAQVDQAEARITKRLFNWLASTEVGSIAFTSLETPDDHRWHRLVPGRGVEVVDEFDRPVPVGEIGRVRVSTAGGPTSYLNDETATRAFFKDGFFYPGDLAVIRSDGRMALQGRLTDVINMQGAKISLSPIEDRLREIFGVGGVCLFSMQNDSGEEEIHVVIETSVPIDSEKLTAAFSQVPELRGFHLGLVHCVATLARNLVGKVLRHAVRAQVVAGLDGSPPGLLVTPRLDGGPGSLSSPDQ
jgi:fatty-acyl-CoA synthase/long-chain acyl-CoA synthetase